MRRSSTEAANIFFGFVLAVSLIFGFGGRSEAEESSRLSAVRPLLHARELEVAVDVDGPFNYDFFKLQDPWRLVIDLKPVDRIDASAEIRVEAMGVLRIRTGRPASETARIVFELAAPYPLFLIAKKTGGLVVTFFDAGGGRQPKSVETARPAPSPPAEKKAVPLRTDLSPVSRKNVTLAGAGLTNIRLVDKRFETVYGRQTTLAWAVEFSQEFLKKTTWSLAAAAEYRSSSLEGRSTITGQKSLTTLMPLDIGLRLYLEIGAFRPYTGVGPVFYSYREESPLQNTLGYTTGISLQTGVYWGPPSLPILRGKAFLKWTRALAEENGLNVNLGGIEIGAGLALAFSFF